VSRLSDEELDATERNVTGASMPAIWKFTLRLLLAEVRASREAAAQGPGRATRAPVEAWIRAFGHLSAAVAPYVVVNVDDPEAMAAECVAAFRAPSGPCERCGSTAPGPDGCGTHACVPAPFMPSVTHSTVPLPPDPPLGDMDPTDETFPDWKQSLDLPLPPEDDP
jgi:hypothetical protein